MRLDFAPGYAAPTPFAAPRRQDRQRLPGGGWKRPGAAVIAGRPGRRRGGMTSARPLRDRREAPRRRGFRLSFRCFYFILSVFSRQVNVGADGFQGGNGGLPEPERIRLFRQRRIKLLRISFDSDGGIDKNAPGNPAFEWEAACAGGRLPFRCGRRNIRKAGGWAWG